jgi:hypothetical protein
MEIVETCSNVDNGTYIIYSWIWIL